MLKKTSLYYFSPTGGTKKVAGALTAALAEEVELIDLGKMDLEINDPGDDVIVVAAPVFGGRIPALVSERIADLSGNGRKAVSLVVYGNRAYEDALLELNDTLSGLGFSVTASGAFIAQHSMAPDIAAGRPDEEDLTEIQKFAEDILKKLGDAGDAGDFGETGGSGDARSFGSAVDSGNARSFGSAEDSGNADCGQVKVPGNRPYKERTPVSAVPLSTAACVKCGECRKICPTGAAITAMGTIVTDKKKCIQCMACAAVCPNGARILPPSFAEKIEEMLAPLKDIRKANETFL